MVLFWIIASTFVISLISFVGVFGLLLKEETLRKFIFPLVAFSAGALLAGAMLHLIPEALDQSESVDQVFLWVLFGFSLFFMLEQFIQWHHCHKLPSEHKHPVTYLILLSDGVHNFIDGLAIGAAFLVNINLGIVTSLAVMAHEIPQELGDFGILVHGGWKSRQALFFNFFSGLASVAGGVLVYFLSSGINMSFLLPIAAGNFIYIASSDLIPEIKHSDNFCADDFFRNFFHFIYFLIGIILLWVMKLLF